MNKEELINHLKELPALEEEWRECAYSLDKDWLVGGELTQYKAFEKLVSDIDEQVDIAKETIPYPIPEYPEEYQAIKEELQELAPYIEQVREIHRALINLNYASFPQARRVRDIFSEKSAEEIKYRDLSEAKERKERTNSKVEKLRMAAHETYNAEVKRVKEETRERLESEHADVLKRGRELALLASKRRQEKLAPISAKIKGLLDTIYSEHSRAIYSEVEE